MAYQMDTPAFSARRHSSSASAPGNRAFMVESLVLLAFLAVSVAIVLQLFAGAGLLSRSAHVLSLSEHLATNAAEGFGANPRATTAMSYFDDNGNEVPNADGAAFVVETAVSSSDEPAGTMYHASITVLSYQNNPAGETTYNLETQRYLSDAEGGGA